MIQNKNNKGFTILEVVIVMAVLAIVIFAMSTFQVDVFKNTKSLQESLSATQELRIVLKKIINEIRPAEPSATGAYIIALAQKDFITFFSDIDDDGLVEETRYFLDGSDLKKGVITPSGSPLSYNPLDEIINIVLQDVVNPNDEIFNFYDKNYPEITSDPLVEPININEVRLVEITLTVNHDPNRSPDPLTNTSQVSIRNLKDNY